jgi:hypothetical protein
MSGQEPRPLNEQPRFTSGPASRVYESYAESKAHNSVKTNNAPEQVLKIHESRTQMYCLT